MATLALAREFLSGYSKLELTIQKRVQELAEKCRQMSLYELSQSKGTHLEPYENQKDPRARTVRLGDNHRGIALVAEGTEQIVLVDVLKHDDADRWMLNNEFKVNAATGALEVVNAGAIAGEADKITQPAGPTATLLFEHRKDKDFTQLGINQDLIPNLRLLQTEDQLQGLLSVLPQGQADALIMLTGIDPVETIYSEIAGSTNPDQIDTDDLAAAVVAPASRSAFHVVANEDELSDMLAQPLAQWKTYLHESQRDAAYRPVYNGPVRVTGGAGTGKTVVAIHRVKGLAESLGSRDGTPILFTTFTRNLAQSIEHDLRALGGSELLDVTDILNVDRLAHRVVTAAEGKAPGVIPADQLSGLWEDTVDELGYDFSPVFLEQEWEQVVLAQNLQSRDEYFQAARTGRGRRLDRKDRAKVWKAIESVAQQLVGRNQRTYLQIAAAAAGYLNQETVKPYQHVIVDEAQDLHESQWRLLRAAVPEQTNDMFLVGDSHQRIYDRRSSLSKVGINIRGRSRKLRINYRTTHEILRWSLALLGEGDYDDLDEGTENHDIAGYHSFIHGSDPISIGFASKAAMIDGVVSQVRQWIDDGVDETEIAVTARTKTSFPGVEQALRARGIMPFRLEKDLKSANGVALGTMHRLKGLEYRCVAVIDAADGDLPLPYAVTSETEDATQHAVDLRRERCLLYVACTRAREDLWVGWSGTPSRFLRPVLDLD